MKKIAVMLAVCVMAAGAQAVIVEDFSGDLSEWTSTVILDNNGGASNLPPGRSPAGTPAHTTAFDGLSSMPYPQRSESCRRRGTPVDVIVGQPDPRYRLYVGGTEPQTGSQDYIAMYRRNSGQLFSAVSTGPRI